MPDWPHQTQGVADVRHLFEQGVKRILLTSPTGGGKSRMFQRIIEWGLPTVVYTNRKMLVDQLSEGLTAAKIPHGIMAAGYAEETTYRVQIASIQTVATRWGKKKLRLHPAKIVIVDECHNEKGRRMREVLDAHIAAGAVIIGATATPVGLGGIFEVLVQAGTTSELRACGALVPALTYAPDEPDWKAFKQKQAAGMLNFRDELTDTLLPVIFGRVREYLPRTNPELKPTILFAPGVEYSQWFASQLTAAGIPSAHIDGDKIWMAGDTTASDKHSREELRRASESGEIKVVCNRFVLREGVDWPHLAHCIFACTFGSVTSYLQAGGRILRSHPSLEHVTIQDHGGNWHRHDSLNADRVWHLDDTEGKLAAERMDRLREKKEPEPITCPQCSKVRSKGNTCPACGYTSPVKRRQVIQESGELVEVRGDIYKPRRVSTDPEDHKIWKSCVFRCRNSGRTFSQARALFQLQTGKVPGAEFPFVPQQSLDWYRRVDEVIPKRPKRTA